MALRRRVEVAELLEQQWVLPGESILRSVLEEAHQGELEAELLDASKQGRASPPIVLPQPNDSSMRFLFRWLTA